MEETELFGRYHRLVRELAARRLPHEVWRSDLRRILRSYDDDCRKLSGACSGQLRHELSHQIEHEILGCTDPEQGVVLTVALKHLQSA